MGEPLRVAVVGLNVGKLHLWSYQQLPERFRVVAVCDIDAARVERAVARNPGAVGLTDLREVCERDDVDVVNLCTPPLVHLDQIAQVLDADKHVVCEKPLVASLEAVDEIERLEAASAKRVMPIFQYRWGRGLQRLKHLVDTGVSGPLHTSSAEIAWRRRAEYYAVPWRGTWAGELGGVLTSHAIHAIDMLTYAAGPVERVFARTSTRVNPIETEDCAAASFLMADGSLATLVATLGSPQEITRHRFNYANLSAESGTEPYQSASEPWTITPDSRDAAKAIEEAMMSFSPGAENYVGQFERFSAALESGDELPVTVADARAVLELLTAMYVSSREGVEVSLPLPPDHTAYRGWSPT
jgi:predicted dehydrogenase